MKILAIDSSGLTASVAIVTEDNMLAEYTIHHKKTHSQTLLPMIDEIVKMIDLNLEEIDGIAVAAGPGSFTGLRIGSATAKGLGLALNKPLIHIPTVDAMAYNFYGSNLLICPMIDARREQVFTGIYTFEKGEFKIMSNSEATSVVEIIDKLNQYNREVIFLGDGVTAYGHLIKENVKVPYQVAPIHHTNQRAGSVGTLALQYYTTGKIETAAEHVPDYYRLSQAERELAEKNNS